MKKKNKALILLFLFVALVTITSTATVSAAEEPPHVEEISFTDGGASTISSLEMVKPLNIHVDDLLVLIIASDNSADGIYFNDVVGWTKLEEAGNSEADCHIAVYYKIANGSSVNTIVTTTGPNHLLGWILRIHGVDTNDTIEASNFGSSIAAGTQPQEIPSINTAEDNTFVLYGIAFDGGDGFPMDVVSPYIEISDRTNTGTPNIGYCCGSIGYRNLAVAGASGIATVYTDGNMDGASFFQVAINGDILSTTPIEETGILYDLFLSLEMWGYLGPFALVVIGYVLANRETVLGVLWFIVECLFVSRYLELVGATPNYWWHILIILLGGLYTCIFPQLLKRR